MYDGPLPIDENYESSVGNVEGQPPQMDWKAEHKQFLELQQSYA